jgi:hypothetical protein
MFFKNSQNPLIGFIGPFFCRQMAKIHHKKTMFGTNTSSFTNLLIEPIKN